MLDSPIQHLARRIHQTRPIDRAGKLALAKELQSFRARTLAGVGQSEIDRLEAAAMLMAFLASADEFPVEALQVVARLTASLDDRLFSAPAPRSEPTPSAETQVTLSAASRLGDILVHTGIVTPEQLAEALRIQPSWKQPLGACLEKMGAATGAQIARALELQARLRGNLQAEPSPAGPLPRGKETRLELRDRATRGPELGELLIEQGTLTRGQLEQGQRLQRAAGLSLGEAVVQLGFASKEQIKQMLHLQERLRR